MSDRDIGRRRPIVTWVEPVSGSRGGARLRERDGAAVADVLGLGPLLPDQGLDRAFQRREIAQAAGELEQLLEVAVAVQHRVVDEALAALAEDLAVRQRPPEAEALRVVDLA